MNNAIQHSNHKTSALAEKLITKFLDKTAVIGVVGLGYVGLPLSVIES